MQIDQNDMEANRRFVWELLVPLVGSLFHQCGPYSLGGHHIFCPGQHTAVHHKRTGLDYNELHLPDEEELRLHLHSLFHQLRHCSLDDHHISWPRQHTAVRRKQTG